MGSVQVAKRRAYLFNYMLFLRITPTLPNTFINVCSPIVDIPYPTFLVATVIGLMPATFITVRVSCCEPQKHIFFHWAAQAFIYIYCRNPVCYLDDLHAILTGGLVGFWSNLCQK